MKRSKGSRNHISFEETEECVTDRLGLSQALMYFHHYQHGASMRTSLQKPELDGILDSFSA